MPEIVTPHAECPKCKKPRFYDECPVCGTPLEGEGLRPISEYAGRVHDMAGESRILPPSMGAVLNALQGQPEPSP